MRSTRKKSASKWSAVLTLSLPLRHECISSASSQCQSAEGGDCRAVNSGALGSVQFKMVSVHLEKPIYTPPCLSSRWYLCIWKITCTFHSVSVQDGIYAFGKSHVLSILSLFKMVSMHLENPVYLCPVSQKFSQRCL